MSTFTAIHRDGLDRAVLPMHGETVTYTPSGGSATAITAIVERDPVDTVPTDRGNQPRRARRIRVSKSDVATVTIGADTVLVKTMADDASYTTYSVGAILEDHAGAWLLDLGG